MRSAREGVSFVCGCRSATHLSPSREYGLFHLRSSITACSTHVASGDESYHNEQAYREKETELWLLPTRCGLAYRVRQEPDGEKQGELHGCSRCCRTTLTLRHRSSAAHLAVVQSTAASCGTGRSLRPPLLYLRRWSTRQSSANPVLAARSDSPRLTSTKRKSRSC